ncbi:MAG: hypothetical protein MJD61_16385 [Proteobacteria bacterium]|nr:hypothetical protein [Pseudomonadota bacterium]
MTSTAAANGRYPAAQQLIEDPNDPLRLIVRATYGLLVSRDGGASWSLICEEAVGYGGMEDPVLGLFGDGTLMAGLLRGLAVSHDGGCDWARAPGALSQAQIVDVTVHPRQRARGLALGSERRQGGGYSHSLWQTSDHGASWQELGVALPAELDLLATAFDAAPSDPRRLYVSALHRSPNGIEGVLLRSDDRAASWTLFSIPGTGLRSRPYFSAVAPNDPDTIYVRVHASEMDRELLSAPDRLLVSGNGGRTWRSVLEGTGVMAGFALSPDGSELAIGFGLAERSRVRSDAIGIWKASTRDLVFAKLFDGRVHCLTWTLRGLYACLSERRQGFQLGLSQDGGQRFGPLMKLRSATGLACPSPSTLTTVCAEPWQRLCRLIGAPGAVAGVPAAATAPTPCRATSSFPALPGDSGPGGTSTASPPSAKAAGCGCHLVAAPSAHSAPWLLLLLAAAVLATRFKKFGLRRPTSRVPIDRAAKSPAAPPAPPPTRPGLASAGVRRHFRHHW